MGRVSTDWMILEDGTRMLSVCRDGIPIFLANQWLEYVSGGASSPRTPTTYAERLVVFFRWLDQVGKPLEMVTARDLTQFRNALRLGSDAPGYLFQRPEISEQTRYLTLSCAIRFVEWAAQPDDDTPILQPESKKARRTSRGMLRGLVAADIKQAKPSLLQKLKKRLPKVLTDKEVDVVIKWVERRWAKDRDLLVRNRALLSVLLETGIRISELAATRLDGFDDINRMLLVPYDPSEYDRVRKTGSRRAALVKTGERKVVIGQETVKHVNEYIMLYRPREAVKLAHGRLFCNQRAPYRGQPMTQNAVEHLFNLMNRPLSKGGVGLQKHLHPHMWRHTSATRLRRRGADSRSIQGQLGHADANSTRIYDEVSPEQRRENIDEANMAAEEKRRTKAQEYADQKARDWGIDD